MLLAGAAAVVGADTFGCWFWASLNDDEPGEVPSRAVGVCVIAELPFGRVTHFAEEPFELAGDIGLLDTDVLVAALPGRAVVEAFAIESAGFVSRVCALPMGGLNGDLLFARDTGARATERGTLAGIRVLAAAACLARLRSEADVGPNETDWLG